MSKHPLTDKQRIKALKVVILACVLTQGLTIFAAVDMFRVIRKTHSESLRNTLRRIFDVVEPTVEQLKEIQAILEFDNEFEDWVKDLA